MKAATPLEMLTGFSPFPAPQPADLDAKWVRKPNVKLPGSWPFPEPPDSPHCCRLLLCSLCPLLDKAAGQGEPLGKGLRGLRPAAPPSPWHLPPPLSLFCSLTWLNPSPGTLAPADWWWESPGALCFGWGPSSRHPGLLPRRGMLGAVQGSSSWERGPGKPLRRFMDQTVIRSKGQGGAKEH